MRNAGVGSWLYRRCRRSAPQVDVVFEEQEITYGDLLERADRLANALVDRGVTAGDRVAYLGGNEPSYIETLFAVGTIGAIFVPLNTRLAVPELHYMLGDSESHTLVFSEAHHQQAVDAARDTAVQHLIVTGGAATAPVEDYEEVLAAASPEHRDEAVDLDDPGLILYTSGTTGQPKGAVLSHRNLTFGSLNFVIDYDIVSTDVLLLTSPLFHIASLGHGLLAFVLKGGRMILEAGFDPGRALDLIPQHQVTQLTGVPTTYQMLLDHPDWETTDVSTVRGLACGGSVVPLRVIEAYERRGIPFTNAYGMTEGSPGACKMSADRVTERPESSGQAHMFTDVRIRRVSGDPCEEGEVGEIQIQGPNVTKGYWRRPGDSRSAFADDVWFRTGDLGYFDDEQFIYISDRLKDMIISGGENVYPAEVEQVIRELPEVADVAVIGIPDEKWGEVPRAVIQLQPGAEVSEAAVLEHLQGRLARYKQPKSVRFVGEFPRTASGKVRKNILRDDPALTD